MTRSDAFSRGPVDRDLEIRSALGLLRVSGIGSMRANRLVRALGGARAVMSASVEELTGTGVVNESGARAVRSARAIMVDDPAMLFLREHRGATGVLLQGDPAYPPLLRHIAQPPMLLWARGETIPPGAPMVAVVGSRRATERGRSLAYKWAYRLASAGVVVVSGLAEGIDKSAHEGALGAGAFTVAVMGTGINRVYPNKHRQLAREIGESGLLLSEFDPGTGARPHHFPQRNRIIAGMSHAVIVVEAEEESGSLITARLAQDEGREVGLVPGWPGDPTSAGTNAAIQASLGSLVRSPEDILNLLASLPNLDWAVPEYERAAVEARATKPRSSVPSAPRKTPVRAGTAAGRIRERLKEKPSTMDDLLMDTGLERADLERTLLDLLVEQRINLGPDHRYRWLR